MADTDIKNLAGYDDGEELDSGEVVVADYDEDGKLVGWHKELKKGKE